MTEFSGDIEKTFEILGRDNVDCLGSLFSELKGCPPSTERKRYRANHPDQMKCLEYLEHEIQLIKTKTIDMKQYYHIRPYVLPLINADKLLQLMSKIYDQLAPLYKEHLDDSITREELLKTTDAPDSDVLDALYYLSETHTVRVGQSEGFPYKANSHINISEQVLLKTDLIEVLSDYYRWNIIKSTGSNSSGMEEIIIPKVKIEYKDSGRPSSGEDIIAAYELLKDQGKIDFSASLQAHTKLIQETYKQLRKSSTAKGANYKTITKYLGHTFREDKKSIN